MEFFAGIGLVREALEQAGWRCVFANDIDPKKEQLYTKNFGTDHFVLGDIDQLDPAVVPPSMLATASFPCIDLSLAGARRGLAGKHSGTFWAFARILKEMGPERPPLVMLENVPGFLTSNNGSDFIAVIEALNDLGYRCDAFQVDAIHFVPQSRARIFVVGALGEIMPRYGTAMWGRPTQFLPPALRRLIAKNLHLNWGEMPLPPLPSRKQHLKDILEDVPDDSDLWWPAEEVKKLLDSMSELHRRKAAEMARGEDFSYGTVYRRVRDGVSRAELRTDGVAGALRTPRGGSSRQFLFMAGRGQYKVRVLTGREYGRLQGVRDSYRLDGISENHARFGFGDAVCVPAVVWIAENCLNPLAEEIMRAMRSA